MNLRTHAAKVTLSTVAGVALAATTLVAVPSTAHAANISSATIAAVRTVSESGPATCTVTGGSSNSSGPFTSNGATVTKTASGTTTLVDPGDAGDTSSVDSSATSKVRATESAGQLRSVDIDSTFTGSVNAAQGLATDCDAQVQVASQAQFQFVLGAPRWVTIDADLPPGTTMQVIFQRTAPATPLVQQLVALFGSVKGHASAELLLPAGTYISQGVVAVQWAAPQVAGAPTSFAETPHIHIDFTTVGTAKGAAVGTGTKYAKLKDGRDCATNRLTGKFSKAAGTKTDPALKKAVFKVNGAKVKVIKKPAKGGKIKLKGLPSDEDISVQATFKLVGGGSTSFTREYFSCT